MPDAPNWADILTATSTPIIAIAGIVIALAQYKIAKIQLRQSLYEKRLSIYKAAKELILHAVRRGTVDDIALNEYVRSTSESSFLLNRELEVYLDSIYERAVDLQTAKEEKSENNIDKQEVSTLIRKISEDKKWLVAQAPIIKEKFRPYLSIG